MNEILLQVRSVESKTYRKIWIDVQYVLADFMEEWNADQKRHAYIHQIYGVEERRFLNIHQTVYENGLCSMDHIIVI